MTPSERKAAIAAYKERKTPVGVFAIRCSASGQVWVGASRHLDTQQNGMWLSLKLGSHRNRGMQAAWVAHGAPTFSFEAMEQLPDDTSAYLQPSLLKEKAGIWRQRLGAEAV